MRALLQDAEHLARIAGLFLAGFFVFLVVRWLLVPEGFGALGHFRAGALADNAARMPVHAGREACGECHDEILARRVGGKHQGIGCESCHGPAAAHATDPSAGSPEPPDPATLCAGCHARRAGRPAWFPQVDVVEHAGDASCGDCHDPHRPGLE